MKSEIPKRASSGFKDYLSLGITTFGVGYLPLAPGTYGSAVGVLIFLGLGWIESSLGPAIASGQGWSDAATHALFYGVNAVLFVAFILVGVWAAGRSTELLGSLDPPQAVVDEVIGQLLVFAFVPLSIAGPSPDWVLIIAGFLLFRLFDVWKPYPIDDLQNLPAGLGVCADDILAGAYAGACLAVLHAVRLAVA